MRESADPSPAAWPLAPTTYKASLRSSKSGVQGVAGGLVGVGMCAKTRCLATGPSGRRSQLGLDGTRRSVSRLPRTLVAPQGVQCETPQQCPPMGFDKADRPEPFMRTQVAPAGSGRQPEFIGKSSPARQAHRNPPPDCWMPEGNVSATNATATPIGIHGESASQFDAPTTADDQRGISRLPRRTLRSTAVVSTGCHAPATTRQAGAMLIPSRGPETTSADRRR